MVYHLSEEQKKISFDQSMKIIFERNHEYIDGQYESKFSKLIVYCPKHKKILKTTFTNYKRSVCGCPECGLESKSKKLKGRIFSSETIKKMQAAAQLRPNRNGKPRDWREENAYKVYRKKVRENFGHKCAITGKSSSNSPTPLVIHHLISAHLAEDLAYEPLNGIVLNACFHRAFHKIFGYKNNSISQMQQFLLDLISPKNKKKIFDELEKCEKSFLEKKLNSMPISSQVGLEKPTGPETRAYNPDRITELHERLGQIEKEIFKKYYQES